MENCAANEKKVEWVAEQKSSKGIFVNENVLQIPS